MPDKSHKSPSQLGQILRGMNRLNKRVDGLAHDLNSFRKETAEKFEATAQEIQTARQEFAKEMQVSRQKSEQDVQSTREELSQEIQTLRQDMAQRFEHQGNVLQKQIGTLTDQINAKEEKDAKFRSEVMSMVDYVVRKYDLFEHEKTALGAGQDRLQREIGQ